MAWTGTEKQIAWAKAIKAEADPIIDEWRFTQIGLASRLQQRTSRFDPSRSSRLRDMNTGIFIMQEAQKIEDARFWIDMRDCPDMAHFIAAAELWLQRRGGARA